MVASGKVLNLAERGPLLFYLYLGDDLLDTKTREIKNSKTGIFWNLFNTLNGLIPYLTFIEFDCRKNSKWCFEITQEKNHETTRLRPPGLVLVADLIYYIVV